MSLPWGLRLQLYQSNSYERAPPTFAPVSVVYLAACCPLVDLEERERGLIHLRI